MCRILFFKTPAVRTDIYAIIRKCSVLPDWQLCSQVQRLPVRQHALKTACMTASWALTDVCTCGTDAMHCSSRYSDACQPSMEIEGAVKVNDMPQPGGPARGTTADRAHKRCSHTHTAVRCVLAHESSSRRVFYLFIAVPAMVQGPRKVPDRVQVQRIPTGEPMRCDDMKP